MTYKTGGIYSDPKTWVEESRTEHFITFCLLRWSEDCLNESGVMYKTTTMARVKIGKNGWLYKKPYGQFSENPDPITVKDSPPLNRAAE